MQPSKFYNILKVLSSPFCACARVCLQFGLWYSGDIIHYITAYMKLHEVTLPCLNCAINMDESFALDEIEQREIEEVAQVPHADIISVWSCRGICLRERGRNACPCKGIEQYCSYKAELFSYSRNRLEVKLDRQQRSCTPPNVFQRQPPNFSNYRDVHVRILLYCNP